MVGRPVLRSDEKVQGIEIRDIMVGDDASKARQNLKINLPMGTSASVGLRFI
jgi:actin-related protein 2